MLVSQARSMFVFGSYSILVNDVMDQQNFCSQEVMFVSKQLLTDVVVQHSGRASFRGDVYIVSKWTRNVHTKTRKYVPMKRNSSLRCVETKFHFLHTLYASLPL